MPKRRQQLGERKLNKTRGNKGAEQVPRTIILSFTCCCHRTGSKGGVQGAVTPAISVTLPADEVVLPWLACEPVLPLPSIFSPMLICGLKFLQNFWLFSLFFLIDRNWVFGAGISCFSIIYYSCPIGRNGSLRPLNTFLLSYLYLCD